MQECRCAGSTFSHFDVKTFRPASVYGYTEACCASANLTTAHHRSFSLHVVQTNNGRERGGGVARENKNKSECAGSLMERSALFTSSLASELPLTFDYCGAKPASTEVDLCIISPRPRVWINRHACAQLWACARLCSTKALPAIVTPGFTFLLHISIFLTLLLSLSGVHSGIRASVPLISSGCPLISSHLSLGPFVTIYSWLKWFRGGHVRARARAQPDTKE